VILAMNDRLDNESERMDPAAVLGIAMSLWEACQKAGCSAARIDLSDAYGGMDQLMREVMRIGEIFESWACCHVAFEETDEVWPYFLHDCFGPACLMLLGADELSSFAENDCLRIAMQLHLPVRLSEGLPIPVDLSFPNPSQGSAFLEYRIQTMRRLVGEDGFEAFRSGDDPWDDEYEMPFFSLQALDRGGRYEWIADRKTYEDAAELLGNLVTAIPMPTGPLVVKLVPLRDPIR
jgi:hypothetical protein